MRELLPITHNHSQMDIEERMRKLWKSIRDEEDINGGDTFAERAEWYYQKRPELLALLQDLYSGYTALLERSCNGKRQSFHLPAAASVLSEHGCCSSTQDDGVYSSDNSDHGGIDYWDAESSISYQRQNQNLTSQTSNTGNIVARIVINDVEKNLLAQQVEDMEKQAGESSRRTDLLKKLIEVLDSERMVLLNENVKLSYKVTTLLEENQELSTNLMFFKRKADDLSRCALKIREDHRVCMLTRKIEDLQEQINGLEKQNKAQRDGKRCNSVKENIKSGGQEVVAMIGCFQFEKIRLKKNSGQNKKKRVSKWWQRVKRMDHFMCGHYYYASDSW